MLTKYLDGFLSNFSFLRALLQKSAKFPVDELFQPQGTVHPALLDLVEILKLAFPVRVSVFLMSHVTWLNRDSVGERHGRD